MSLRRFSTQTMVALLVVFVTSCKDREITSYRAPKDAAPAMAGPPTVTGNTNELPPGHPPIGDSSAGASATPNAPMAGAQMPGGGNVPVAGDANGLSWTPLAHWIVKPNGPVRKGSYTVPGEGGATADLSVTAFPGDTGGLFANINRWRGQIGLPAITEAQLSGDVEHVDLNGFHIDVVSMNGPTNSLLGAIVPHNGQTWFFKMAGPAAIINREKTTFTNFLNSIKPAQP